MSKLPVRRVHLKKPRDLELLVPKFGSEIAPYNTTIDCERSKGCNGAFLVVVMVLCISAPFISLLIAGIAGDHLIPYWPLLPWVIFPPIIAILINCRIREFDCCCRKPLNPQRIDCFCECFDYDDGNCSTCEVRCIYLGSIGFFWVFFLLWALHLAGVPNVSSDAAPFFLGPGGSVLALVGIIYIIVKGCVQCYRESSKNEYKGSDAPIISGIDGDKKDAAGRVTADL